jgi:hypothetical protein
MVDVVDFSPWLIGMNRASSCHHRAISSTYPKSPIAAEEWSGRSVAALARQGSLVEAKHRLASLCNTIEIRLYIHRVPAIAWVDAL